MVTIDRILCAVDLSGCSRTALTHALALSRWYQAKLAVLHVFRPFNAVESGAVGPSLGLDASVELATVAREQAEAQVRALVASVPGAGGVETTIIDGVGVRETILQHAASVRADLLVLGSHGMTGVSRLILGSTAESVLHHATVPVLIVPPHAEALPATGVPFKRIVCAVDFEAESYRALEHALRFAQESDAQLTFVHVVQMPTARRVPGVEAVDEDDARRAFIRDARERLEALVPEAARAFCTVHIEVTEGRPAAEILRCAEERQADLVVMGVRGRDVLDLALFGSQTRAVIHAARCPVLTVRQD